jgi:hypothetical protein
MPKNTLKFWKNLRREKLNNTNCLGSLRFAIFGLGDSSYPKCVRIDPCCPLRHSLLHCPHQHHRIARIPSIATTFPAASLFFC